MTGITLRVLISEQVPLAHAFKIMLEKDMFFHGYYTDSCSNSSYCSLGLLSRYYVNMCLYLLCRQILLVPSSLPDKYPDTYGLIYQPLSRQNNLSHIFNFT